ncbi:MULTISPECIES: nicotinamide riboside transporter PnuC [Chryseobacterium]|uniref:Nicotinamide riboside transporter PnuC n=1 Tax=Chryseobacterium camelliae TaxID=1265445 RepID=A0ABU0TFJ2_9FLAO|nr:MULTISPECIES: nicotinamide riboside transporter PnuC [Chryseobacterium]MDT3406465.1 nicotinamide mononucleotide transporter [Pseudacidovorax intermedius]MDQ1095736.1 nicotinamide mononucleotide transporter [Chryseobacterium camelliae]MDQ1099673.1 nicotinamide mononucleotide transporter [Chryseobacterium sp. SORGH_AS_1048]MDR6087021.1 nicotinamide mononucleotide transporter [Chryseobacterium sp. SORGH_AS_0909]MDR6131393.1 nicotinamide mononucleotide transporter [Chryseobacterium sp. SORGH_AS
MNAYDLFVKPYESYQTGQIFLEIAGTFFGILSVYFSIKKNIWVYPTGIVSTLIYVYILFQFGLFGDCLINVYYTAMSIYGWILWAKSSQDNIHVEVSWATAKEWLMAGLLFTASLILVTIVYYYKPFIDHQFSMEGVSLGLYHLDWANWMDVFTTSVFLAGMWLMAKRKIENWIFWIIGDLICIPMMIFKGLGITSVQYLVFTIMAVSGYVNWKKSFKEKNDVIL